jgi:hypothetical protein
MSQAEDTMSAQAAREDVPRNPEDARAPGDASLTSEGTRRAPEEPPATGLETVPETGSADTPESSLQGTETGPADTPEAGPGGTPEAGAAGTAGAREAAPGALPGGTAPTGDGTTESTTEGAAGTPLGDVPAAPPGGPAAPASGPAAEDSVPRAELAAGEEMQQFVTRWREIQAEFVDEPKSAVAKADALVVETLERLAAMFERERTVLEQRWSGSGETSTEDLRQSLRRYRELFERLLAV